MERNPYPPTRGQPLWLCGKCGRDGPCVVVVVVSVCGCECRHHGSRECKETVGEGPNVTN